LAQPQISVVIPVYNGEAFVADAIESVLDQKGAAFELIVIDDGSTDWTPSILRRYSDRISVYCQSNCDVSAARNAAIPYMRGELALFLDADDLIPQGYLARFASAAIEAPEIEVFHCGWRIEILNGELLDIVEEPLPIDNDPFHQVPYWASPVMNAILVRRSALERVGGFDPTLKIQEDFDFCLRLAASGARFRGIPGNMAIVRRRTDSISALRHRELAAVTVAVMERHVGDHYCSACKLVDEALRLWRRKALLADAAQLARRAGITGRLGNWTGMVLAVLRRPSRLGVALDHAVCRLNFPARWLRRGSNLSHY
jgi:glycosyltransferase involved in cell wall biosynthesis